MSLENLVDEKNGHVIIPIAEHPVVVGSLTFEAIETIYKKIKPLLDKRRKMGIIEGASK